MPTPATLASQVLANFRRRMIKSYGFLFSSFENEQDARTAGQGVYVSSGPGAPTVDIGTNVRGVYYREDAPTVDTLIYVTVDGPTWTPFSPAGLDWYTGTITAPAADDPVGVHAANGDDVQAWPGAFTSPVVPRNVTITFEAAWAGGNVTVVGTDHFDAALTETLVASAGARVDGVKVFKTVTGISHAAAGPGGLNHDATAGWGHKLGVAQTLAAALGILSVDGVTESAEWDTTYDAFTPTNVPDGARDFTWAVPT